MSDHVLGIVYLVHFEDRIGGPGRNGAQHYVGWTADQEVRMEHHRNGTGARILAFCNSQGINYNVVRTWQGTRYMERRMKSHGHHERRCPVCQR